MDTCELCDPNHYPAKKVGDQYGNTYCKPCVGGAFAKPGDQHCKQCKPGFYIPLGSADSNCLSCAPGTYSWAMATSCTKCPKGQYANQPRASICPYCPANSVSEEGSIECTPCSPGYVPSLEKDICVTEKEYKQMYKEMERQKEAEVEFRKLIADANKPKRKSWWQFLI